ncbi:MAG: carboxymuconolactone decarboxylase family protein [Candidatus Hydrogenedentota bacterium]
MSLRTGRTFVSPEQFLREFLHLCMHPRGIVRLMRGKSLDPCLRERVMLAVTEVNRCSLCAWAHTRMALQEGLDRDEVNALLHGTMHGVPPEQHTATLFAQHWADTGGKPDADARVHFEAAYDKQTVAALDLAMRFIRFWNYCGVACERFVSWVSFGRFQTSFPAKKGRQSAASETQ